MRVLRLILAGLVAVAAVVAVLFTAVVVVFTGLAAYVVQLFQRRPGPVQSGPPQAPNRQPAMRTDDAIDVVTTKVPDEPAKH
jgi:hypothetical protein